VSSVDKVTPNTAAAAIWKKPADKQPDLQALTALPGNIDLASLGIDLNALGTASPDVAGLDLLSLGTASSGAAGLDFLSLPTTDPIQLVSAVSGLDNSLMSSGSASPFSIAGTFDYLDNFMTPNAVINTGQMTAFNGLLNTENLGPQLSKLQTGKNSTTAAQDATTLNQILASGGGDPQSLARDFAQLDALNSAGSSIYDLTQFGGTAADAGFVNASDYNEFNTRYNNLITTGFQTFDDPRVARLLGASTGDGATGSGTSSQGLRGQVAQMLESAQDLIAQNNGNTGDKQNKKADKKAD
jgi:hypothetical protein